MKRNSKKWIIIGSSIGALSLGSVLIGVGVSLSNKNGANNQNPDINNPEEPSGPIWNNNNIIKNSNIGSFNNQIVKIAKRNIRRNINNQYYETELIKKYGNKFKYPAWNYNYEQKNTDGTLKGIQNIDGESVNGFVEVLNERVKYTNSQGEIVETHFSNADFILNEIKNSSLKKHPASTFDLKMLFQIVCKQLKNIFLFLRLF